MNNLYQVTSTAIGANVITVKAKNPKQASLIARDVISENYTTGKFISIFIRELVPPEDDKPGYCYLKAAENIYQITI